MPDIDDSTREKLPVMSDFVSLKWAILVAVSGMILLISLIVAIYSPLLSFAFHIGSFVYFLWSSLYYIRADPPEKAIPMVNGKYVNQLVGPKWILIPLKGPLLLDYKIVDAKEFALEFEVKEVLPDRTEIVIPISIYFSIDPHNPVQTIIIGGIGQVGPRLQKQVDSLLRRWILSTQRGPQDFDQARQMSEEAVNQILESLTGDDIHRIPSEIPSEALIGFLFKARPLSLKEQEWKTKFDALTESEKNEIRLAAKERLDEINQLRNGKSVFALHSMGIVVKRLVAGNIEPSPTTKIATDKVAAAKFDAEAQSIQAESVRKEAAAYTGVDSKDALRWTLVRRGAIKEDVDVNRIEASNEIIEAAKGLAGQIIEAIVGKKVQP